MPTLKNLFLNLSWLWMLYSCNANQANPDVAALPNEPEHGSGVVDTTGPNPSISASTTSEIQPSPIVDLPSKYKSKFDVMNYIITKNSTKKEVLRVKGSPKWINNSTEDEIWFYDDCELHFEFNYVSGVSGDGPCDKFISIGDLLFSKDRMEAEFGNMLLQRGLKK